MRLYLPLNFNEISKYSNATCTISDVDISNWFLIAEYDFDNNRHGFVAFIQYAQSREGRILQILGLAAAINVIHTENLSLITNSITAKYFGVQSD